MESVETTPLTGPDGYSDRPVQTLTEVLRELRPDASPDDALYQAALDEVALALVKASALKYAVAQPEHPQALTSFDRFRILAGLAVTLVDSGTERRIRFQTIQEHTDDLSIARNPAQLAHDVIETYRGKLMDAGHQAVSR